jgi:hypothetical protein
MSRLVDSKRFPFVSFHSSAPKITMYAYDSSEQIDPRGVVEPLATELEAKRTSYSKTKPSLLVVLFVILACKDILT